LATFAEQLIIAYARTKAKDPSLRKGQYMQRVFPERYKNEASAYQAYNQTVKGKRPGGRLEYLSEQAQPPVQSEKLKQKFKSGELKRRPRPSGTQHGIWKVNVGFAYPASTDEKGNQTYDMEYRSFVAISDRYTKLTDQPYVEEIIKASVDEYISYWLETAEKEGSDPIDTNYAFTTIEVVPIYRYDSEHTVEIDEIEDLTIE
jgi:hypothetical protein